MTLFNGIKFFGLHIQVYMCIYCLLYEFLGFLVTIGVWAFLITIVFPKAAAIIIGIISTVIGTIIKAFFAALTFIVTKITEGIMTLVSELAVVLMRYPITWVVLAVLIIGIIIYFIYTF